MPPRRRPTAFDVSFPDEVTSGDEGVLLSDFSTETNKRKADSDLSTDPRSQHPRFWSVAAFYKPPQGKPQPTWETEDLVLPGEEPLDVDDTPGPDGDDTKPIRRLANFSIFDPLHSDEFVSLHMLELNDGVDRHFEAVGYALPLYENDEDEGQEESLNLVLVRLSAILRCSVDWTNRSAPFFIETLYAWYQLEVPSPQYEPFYGHYYSLRRVAQLVISEANVNPKVTVEEFLEDFTRQNDFNGRTFTEDDLWSAVKEIEQALDDIPDRLANQMRDVPLIKAILRKSSSTPRNRRRNNAAAPRRPMTAALKVHAGDLDFAVLKSENQNTTHVTPLIASFARGLVSEQIVVVGPQPPSIDETLVARRNALRTQTLKSLVMRATRPKVQIDCDKKDRIDVRSDIYSQVTIEGKTLKIGDIVMVKGNHDLPGWNKNGSAQPVKPEHMHCDFFWYCKIMCFVIENQVAHVRWFYHGKKTLMGEIGNEQELFLCNECGNIPMKDIVGQVKVHFQPKDPASVPYDEYFCRLMYEKATGTFRSLDLKTDALCESFPPPENCKSCVIEAAITQNKESHKTKDKGHVTGISYGGTNYHLEDFVLYYSNEGPANIGQIVEVDFAKSPHALTLVKVGRTATLDKSLVPKNFYRDERHLYLTEEKVKIPVSKLIRVIYAASHSCFGDEAELIDWLDLSPYHFYIKYCFPALKIASWADRCKLDWKQIFACSICCREMLAKRKLVKTFLRQIEREPLSTLDLFGGVGAFSGSMAEGSRCFNVDYAIEISPSAAKTFEYGKFLLSLSVYRTENTHRKNWNTKTANQCANVMLRYAIKSESGHDVEVPTQLYDGKTSVPSMPKRGKIKVLTAGFPCQSHSSLNMFHKADDIKSNLMLTNLSYIDWYRPIYVYLENVPGFLSYALGARQATAHKVEGGIKMGGLKLMVRALIEMGYVRFALMQAGNYGAPQRRIRFFLIAALDGHPLPELPQPTHDFLDKKQLKIDCFDGEINPISVLDGKTAHPFVSIEAAIDDLLKFDFEHPSPKKLTAEQRKTLENRKKKAMIATVKCEKDDKYWGFSGQLRYQTPPMTSYQKRARVKDTKDIQHYVLPMPLHVAEKYIYALNCFILIFIGRDRVIHIPLRPDADYRDLPRNQHEWQFVDPMSSHGQKNYKGGAYTRLNANTFFSTIVTNFGPTAKQSKVLHHSCMRTNTVRELARGQGFPDWFVFVSLSKNVKHVRMLRDFKFQRAFFAYAGLQIQRQIGNAVPWQVGHALGRELREALFNDWNRKREEAIRVDESEDSDGDVVMGKEVIPTLEEDSDDDMYV
ncbi:hypothetical protein CVT24_005319 [Panaeolus cyanescens]|uniref:DNA (cytosine-5-)-methyltransferase n=1 Tax=Panaeolus cyanescens TaxID=181874 RepID=A0A409Y976_9AGAR|nr:hypothetical protein CVT24_005319 [Panaeolus cyanescens]